MTLADRLITRGSFQIETINLDLSLQLGLSFAAWDSFRATDSLS
jgi:hypothetical protein